MKLSDNTITKMLNTQNGNCYYCGIKLIIGYRGIGNIDIDHIKPFSKYKDGTRKNLCLSCRDCNSIKLDKDIPEFKQICLSKYPSKLIDGLFYFEQIKL